MAKKGLAALASKQINSTAQPSTPAPDETAAPEQATVITEAPAQSTTGAKRGRPAATTAPDEVNVTLKLSAALMQQIKIKAVMEHTTQKEIFDAALRQYLNN